MDLKTLARHTHITILNPRFNPSCKPHSSLLPSSSQWRRNSLIQSTLRSSLSFTKNRRNRFFTACISPSREIIDEEFEHDYAIDHNLPSVSSIDDKIEPREEDLSSSESIWEQMVEIVKFSGPATGLWLCGPLMSLIDTAVIGQSSSVELAALGPGTVLCDYMSYVFMFLSIATSNLVATALAKQVVEITQ